MTLPKLDMHCHPCHAGGAPIEDSAHVFAVSVTPGEWDEHVDASPLPGGVWGLGLHPWWTQGPERLEGFFERLPRCDAVGEIGIDRSGHALMSFEDQCDVLVEVLDSPLTRERLVNLHALNAYGEMVSILAEHPTPGAVIHWFAEGGETLRRAIELDVFFSVNDAMFAIPDQGRGLPDMPMNRVLAETDAPYIERGTGLVSEGAHLPWLEHLPDTEENIGKRLRSGEMTSIERNLAELWGIEPEAVRLQLWTNLAELESRVTVRPFRAADVLASREGEPTTPGGVSR